MECINKKLPTMHTLLIVTFLMAVSVHLTLLCELWSTGTRLEALVQVWEKKGLEVSVTGRLRTRMAALTWLGWLRPSDLRDPFTECGVPRHSNGWWSGLVRLEAARQRLPCLEEHMAEAEADHKLFEKRLLGLLCLLAIFVVALLAKGSGRRAGGEVGGGTSLRPSSASNDPLQPAIPSSSESSGSSFVIVEAPPPGAGRSLSREVFVRNEALKRLQRSWRWPLEMSRYSPGTISRQRRLKEAMKDALFRRRRKNAGKPVGFHGDGYDSLDWWRDADDGKGKEAVLLEQRLGEWFRPYRYPSPPRLKSCADPFEVFPRRSRPLSLDTQRQEPSQDLRCSPSLAPWEVLLQAVSVLLLAYLCLNGGTTR